MHAIELLVGYPMFRDALITGAAVGIVCSLLSVIVVLKRLAFIGQGISHAGFGGVGTAVLLGVAPGVPQDLLVLLFCVGAAILIGALSRRRAVEVDSAIGILLVAAMAWGVLATDLSAALGQYAWYVQLVGPPQARPGFEALLFGSLLSVGSGQMLMALALCATVIVAFIATLKEILFYTFDETSSRVFGVRTTVVHYLLLGLLSLTIVISIRLVGFVLVSALLVLPGATANLLTRRLRWAFALSLAVGMIGTVGGLLVSLEVGNLSSGPCIVVVLCIIFVVGYAARFGLFRRWGGSEGPELVERA